MVGGKEARIAAILFSIGVTGVIGLLGIGAEILRVVE